MSSRDKAAGYSVTLAQHAINRLKQVRVFPPLIVCSESGCEEVPTELQLMGQKIATLKLDRFATENAEDMEICYIISHCGTLKVRDMAAGDSCERI